MISHRRHSWIVLLAGIAMVANTALGQSLSILRKGKNEIWLEAKSLPDVRYRLQASLDFRDWLDLKDDVSGSLSYQIERSGVAERFFRLTPWTPPDEPVTVVLLGDSTVADFAVNNNWFAGWGEGMHGYFKPNVRIVNLAQAYHSTKVFLASAEKVKMLAIRPDFVLIQFGRIDASEWLGEPYPTTIEEYYANLKTIVKAVRGLEGTPILITPVVPRLFDEKGKVLPALEDRSGVVKGVATETQTFLINLNQMSRDLFNRLGENESAYISWSDKDRTHFSLKGAEVIAGLVVKALPNSLRTHVLKEGAQP